MVQRHSYIICERCGKHQDIEGKERARKYCSRPCRDAAYYERKKQREQK